MQAVSLAVDGRLHQHRSGRMTGGSTSNSMGPDEVNVT